MATVAAASGTAARGGGRAKVLKTAPHKRVGGVDFPADGLRWNEWTVGGDHRLHVRVTNRSTAVVRVSYTPPATRFFFTEYPQETVLSPGMCLAVPVNFRPLAAEDHSDSMEFLVDRAHRFVVPLRADVPQLAALFVGDTDLDMGTCGIGEVAAGRLVLRNSGGVRALFRFDAPRAGSALLAPEPASGSLEPGQSVRVRVAVRPSSAEVFDLPLTCRVAPGGGGIEGQERPRTKQAEIVLRARAFGIAKYTHIALEGTDGDEGAVEFGDVLVGQVAERTAWLCNRSPVRATAWIAEAGEVDGPRQQQQQQQQQPVARGPFTVEPSTADLEPGARVPVRVRYAPVAAGVDSRAEFHFETPASVSARQLGLGGPLPVRLVAAGHAAGPSVSVSALVLQFGDVRADGASRAVRKVTILNNSNRPARFELVLPSDRPSSSLSVAPSQGEIPPLLSATVDVTFAPQDAINYYQTLVCLLEDQDPLQIECLGTGTPATADREGRPAALELRHVRAEAIRASRGLHTLSPADLTKRLEDDRQLAADLRQAAAAAAAADERASAEQGQSSGPRLGRSVRGTTAPSSPSHGQQAAGPVRGLAQRAVINESVLDFGACSAVAVPDSRLATVTNRAPAKMVVVWDTAAPGPDHLDGKGAAAFVVQPRVAEVEPGCTASFRVSFRPTEPMRDYASRLSCTAFFKTNRTFRLVNDDAFVPPAALSVLAVGHTFVSGGAGGKSSGAAVRFPPAARFVRADAHFPPCVPGEEERQSVVLLNDADTPLVFDFDRVSGGGTSPGSGAQQAPGPVLTEGCFQLWPARGVVAPHGFRILTGRFAPPSAGPASAALRCRLNHSDGSSDTLDLLLSGSAAWPAATVDGSGTLHVRPTCPGSSSTATCVLRNSTDVRIRRFGWHVPERYADQIRIEPASGTLRGHEALETRVTLTPHDARSLRVPVTCRIEGTSSGGPVLTVVCDCSRGSLRFDPPALEFGPVLVGASAARPVQIYNDTELELSYALEAGEPRGNAATQNLSQPPSSLKFDRPRGVVPARSHLVVYAVLQPGAAGRIEYEVQSGSSVRLRLTADAAFPRLSLTDARLERTPVAESWAQLSCAGIARQLAEPLSEQEVDACLGGLQQRAQGVAELVASLPANRVDFGMGELHAHAEVAYVRLTNDGTLPADWSVEFPQPRAAELERWADTGTASDEELTRQAVLVHRLFTAEPAAGKLEPGASQCVRLTYHHKFVGRFVLPCLLRVKNGRRVAMCLSGETVASLPHRVYLLPHQRTHRLADVPLGLAEADAPVQAVALPNQTDTDLEYEVDLGAVRALCSQSYDFPVLSCLNPTGVVPAGGVTQLLWRFRPLELREYQLEFDLMSRPRCGAAGGGKNAASAGEPAAWRVSLGDAKTGPGETADVDAASSGSLEMCAAAERSPSPESSHRITLLGRGVRPGGAGQENHRPEAVAADAPPGTRPVRQLQDRAGQLVRLTHDEVDLGAVALGGSARRVVWLANVSTAGPVRFQWFGASDDGLLGSALRVLPAEGVVAPGERVSVHVDLDAGGLPVLVDRQLVCRVERADAAAVAQRRQPSRVSDPGRHGTTRAVRSPRVTSIPSPRPPSPTSPLASPLGVGPSVQPGADVPDDSAAVVATKTGWKHAFEDRTSPVAPGHGPRITSPEQEYPEHALMNATGVPYEATEPTDPLPALLRRDVDYVFLRCEARVAGAAWFRATGESPPAADSAADGGDGRRALARANASLPLALAGTLLLQRVLADPETGRVLEGLQSEPVGIFGRPATPAREGQATAVAKEGDQSAGPAVTVAAIATAAVVDRVLQRVMEEVMSHDS